jgi:hypothetical protein
MFARYVIATDPKPLQGLGQINPFHRPIEPESRSVLDQSDDQSRYSGGSTVERVCKRDGFGA